MATIEYGISGGVLQGVQPLHGIDPPAVPADAQVDYILRMAKDVVVSDALSKRMLMIWRLVRRNAPGSPIPLTVAMQGGPFHCTWDSDSIQLTLEVPETGPCDWFWRDKRNDNFDGGEFEPANGFPSEWLARLIRFPN